MCFLYKLLPHELYLRYGIKSSTIDLIYNEEIYCFPNVKTFGVYTINSINIYLLFTNVMSTAKHDHTTLV